MKEICSFSGRYLWLSNFYRCSVFLDGIYYPTVENAYQAAKTHKANRHDFQACAPGKAKRLGQRVAMMGDWESRKIKVMTKLLRQKFRSGSKLSKRLLETGDAELVEGNYWGDTFWGVCHGVGENHLGKILMKVRSELEEIV